MKNVDPSYPAGDSCCPSCGTLLWWFRNRLSEDFGVDADSTTLSTSFTEVGADSLDIVELVMELEEHFDVAIPDAAAEQIKTVADAIRFIAKSRRIKPV